MDRFYLEPKASLEENIFRMANHQAIMTKDTLDAANQRDLHNSIGKMIVAISVTVATIALSIFIGVCISEVAGGMIFTCAVVPAAMIAYYATRKNNFDAIFRREAYTTESLYGHIENYFNDKRTVREAKLITKITEGMSKNEVEELERKEVEENQEVIALAKKISILPAAPIALPKVPANLPSKRSIGAIVNAWTNLQDACIRYLDPSNLRSKSYVNISFYYDGSKTWKYGANKVAKSWT